MSQAKFPSFSDPPGKYFCRRCGACCIAPSISSPLPKMPSGKPAGIPCPHLTSENLCELFEKPERPAVCSRYAPGKDCEHGFRETFEYLTRLEQLTRF